MKRLKFLAQLTGNFLAIPALLHALLAMALLGRARGFSSASECIARTPGFFGLYARQAFYRRFLANLGNDVHIGFMTLFSKPDASLGNRVYLGRFCIVGHAEIHDDVMIADGVQILSGRHHHGRDVQENTLLRDNPQTFEKVTIGCGAWIGAGAVIMANVGAGAIVAAGAVVVQPVAAHSKVAGIPARPMASVAAA